MYFLEREYGQAREQYEALQSLDPYDLSAMRYLAAIYNKVGLGGKSTEQAAALADRQDDPASAYLIQRFWTMNPSVANEVSPAHVHGGAPESRQISLDKLLRTSAIWPFGQ